MRSEDIRPIGGHPEPDSPERLIRVRGSGGYNLRLRWTGSAYAVTSEAITFYEDSGLIPKTLDDAEETFVVWRPAAERYEQVGGSSSGQEIIYFELTQDKGYADAAKLAKPVLADGTLDSGADAFYVVDEKNEYYGKAATGGEDGYRGFAWKFTDSYSGDDGDKPGWRIVSMQGPAQWLVGQLNGSYSMGGTTVTIIDEQIRGRPSRGERLPASGDITVEDDLDVASSAVDDDKWLIAWDEADEHYIFVLPLAAQAASGKRFYRTNGTITAGSYASSTLTLGSGDAKQLVFSSTGVYTLDSSVVTIYNSVALSIPSGKIVQASLIDGVYVVDVEDCT